MKVVAHAIDHNGVSGIISAGGASTNIDLVAEDVDELSFPLVTPLGAEHDGSHGGELQLLLLQSGVVVLQRGEPSKPRMVGGLGRNGTSWRGRARMEGQFFRQARVRMSACPAGRSLQGRVTAGGGTEDFTVCTVVVCSALDVRKPERTLQNPRAPMHRVPERLVGGPMKRPWIKSRDVVAATVAGAMTSLHVR